MNPKVAFPQEALYDVGWNLSRLSKRGPSLKAGERKVIETQKLVSSPACGAPPSTFCGDLNQLKCCADYGLEQHFIYREFYTKNTSSLINFSTFTTDKNNYSGWAEKFTIYSSYILKYCKWYRATISKTLTSCSCNVCWRATVGSNNKCQEIHIMCSLIMLITRDT